MPVLPPDNINDLPPNKPSDGDKVATEVLTVIGLLLVVLILKYQ